MPFNHTPTPLVLTEAEKKSIRRRSRLPKSTKPTPRPPSLIAKADHLIRATARIVAAAAKGDPINVSKSEREQRLAICRACKPYWRERGNLGMGECMHEDCGCTRLKQRLATETCPAGKW